MCLMLWVLMVALECSRTFVLVSIVCHEHSHPCVNNVYTMYICMYVSMYVYGAIILIYIIMHVAIVYVHVQCIYCCDEFTFCSPLDNE